MRWDVPGRSQAWAWGGLPLKQKYSPPPKLNEAH